MGQPPMKVLTSVMRTLMKKAVTSAPLWPSACGDLLVGLTSTSLMLTSMATATNTPSNTPDTNDWASWGSAEQPGQ